jgi:hypothetical protein
MILTKNEQEIIMLLRELPPYGKIEVSPNREKGADKFKIIITNSRMLE